MRLVVGVALALGGCAAVRPPPVAQRARAVVRRAADTLGSGDAAGFAGLIAPGVVAAAGVLDEAERAAVVARLRALADGQVSAHARVHVAGALGSELWLEHGEEGWRVAPDTASAPMPTPVAAIEQLIAALDRLETDPALALLSSTLRDSLIAAARERARGLREALPRLPAEASGRLTLHVDYGSGLFVVLRPEAGAWRIDDFN